MISVPRYIFSLISIHLQINTRAYEWALEQASPTARERFEKYGMKMVMGDDYHAPLPIGPIWINNKLSMKVINVRGGGKVLRVVSPSMRTPNEGIHAHTPTFSSRLDNSSLPRLEWLSLLQVTFSRSSYGMDLYGMIFSLKPTKPQDGLRNQLGYSARNS